jgi:uncharacterized protein
MHRLPITSLTASLLTLVYLVLCYRVVQGRISTRTSLGASGAGSIATGQEAAASPLLVSTRAHANFAEYVPLSLILLGLVEGQGGARTIVMGLASALVAARVLHPIGLGRLSPNPPRLAGFMLNVIMLLIAAGYLAYLSLM